MARKQRVEFEGACKRIIGYLISREEQVGSCLNI